MIVKNKKAKKIVKETAKTTKNFLKVVFALLVIYISVSSAYGFLTSGEKFLQDVITLSIGGFWAFFFGYFGWRIAESIENYFTFKDS